MATKELEAYNEAKTICDRYVNYKGDRRQKYYKSLARAVSEVYMGRMNNFGKQLGLPTFLETYYK